MAQLGITTDILYGIAYLAKKLEQCDSVKYDINNSIGERNLKIIENMKMKLEL